MNLEAEIGLDRGSLRVEVELAVAQGTTLALLGPNGAGKSTVLRALAGLIPLDRGRIRCVEPSGVETVWDDPSSGVFVVPERRSVGMVFQDYALFAQMSVLENVAFGLRARGVAKQLARGRALEHLERFGLVDHATVRPGALSGGQSQRVALARALVTDPQVLLLDEPLAALDVHTRVGVRRDLRSTLSDYRGLCVLVTHDPVDAYALADRVVVLESGRVAQAGALSEVTMHPRSRYVADLVGLNLLRGEMRSGSLVVPNGTTVVTADSGWDGPAFVTVRPQSVSLHQRQPEGSQRNVWCMRVVDLDRRVDRCRVQLDGPLALVAEVTPAALAGLDLAVGDEVWAAVKATEVSAYQA